MTTYEALDGSIRVDVDTDGEAVVSSRGTTIATFLPQSVYPLNPWSPELRAESNALMFAGHIAWTNGTSMRRV